MEKTDSFGIYIPTLPNTTIKLSQLVETMVKDGSVERLNGNGTIGPFAVTIVRKHVIHNHPSTKDESTPSLGEILDIMFAKYPGALGHLASGAPKNVTIQGFNKHRKAHNLSVRVDLDTKTKRYLRLLGKALTELGYPNVMASNTHLSLAKFNKNIERPNGITRVTSKAERSARRLGLYGNNGFSLGGLVIGATYDSLHPDYQEFLEQYKITR